jgi:hypothetical protein
MTQQMHGNDRTREPRTLDESTFQQLPRRNSRHTIEVEAYKMEQ